MMRQTLPPAKTLQGAIVLPGDRAISQRYAILAAMAEGGATRIKRFSTSAECQSTLRRLEERGVTVERLEEELVIHGKGLDYFPAPEEFGPKGKTLLAGLRQEGETVLEEITRTPDHTEIALREFGADITVIRDVITLQGNAHLTGDRELIIPGDFTIAAYFIAAALLLPGSQLSIYGLGLNPTRTLFLDLLASMGAQAKILDIGQNNGEVVGDIQIRATRVPGGGVLDGAISAALSMDELPALAVLAAGTERGITVKGLREPEPAMLSGLAENLTRLGIQADLTGDGFHVPGKQQFQASQHLDSRGDWRIAMAVAIASLTASAASSMDNAEAATDVFPEFYSTLQQVAS